MATYNKTSPYSTTRIDKANKTLDLLNFRDIPHIEEDITYSIAPEYANRPELLAHDLYGDVNLWWVFMARNPNAFEDPVWDFRAGKKFFIPKKATVETALGI